jgi:hypothetical protein
MRQVAGRRPLPPPPPPPPPLLLLLLLLAAAAAETVGATGGEDTATCVGPTGSCGAEAQQQQPPPTTPTTLGPKELMRQRMLASKHRRRGAAALQAGEAADALAALREAQELTPEDQSLVQLIQRAQVMLGQQGEQTAADPKMAMGNGEGAPVPPRDGNASNATAAVPEPEPVPAAPIGSAEAPDLGADASATGTTLPEGWAEGSLDGTPFYYPVSDPSRILWAPPLVPEAGDTSNSPAAAGAA